MDSIFLSFSFKREITLLCKEKNKDMKKIVGRIFKEIFSDSMQMFQLCLYLYESNYLEIYALKCVKKKRNLFFGKKFDSMF